MHHLCLLSHEAPETDESDIIHGVNAQADDIMELEQEYSSGNSLDIDVAEPSSTTFSPEAQLQTQQWTQEMSRELGIREKFATMAILSDGANSLVKAVVEYINHVPDMGDMIFGKHHRGLSMTQSANDSRHGPHPKIHSMFRGTKFKYDDDYPDPSGSNWQELKQILLKFMDTLSFEAVWKVFCHSPKILERSCSPYYVEQSFEDVGVITRKNMKLYQGGKLQHPSDYPLMLSKNAVF